MTERVMKLRRKLLIINMFNILLTQNLLNKHQKNFAARLAQVDLVTKTDFDKKLSDLNRKIVSNKAKHLVIQNELKK